ncbi:hypothetical protein IAT38_001592 [Cryptococcus sp. DSM 104549]
MVDDPLSSGGAPSLGAPLGSTSHPNADVAAPLPGALNGHPPSTFSQPPPNHNNTHQHYPTARTSTSTNGDIPSTTAGSGFTVLRGNGGYDDWEAEYERQKERAWGEKVDKDLEGWRGGHGKPRSAYPRQALPTDSYFHQPVTGTIGRHLPKEVVRVERDWSGGEVCQFETSFPMELEGRIQPAQFTAFINTLNTHFTSAYAVGPTILDNVIAVASLWTSLLWRKSTFEKGLGEVEKAIREANEATFNPQGLNVLSPRDVALQFLEIEYY